MDWFACILITRLLSPDLTYGGSGFSVVVLAVFAVEVTLLTSLGGASLGQRLFRLRVVGVGGGGLAPLPVAVRTLLLCLAVPPLVFDRDGRGLHDRAARSVVVRSH